MQGFSVLHHCAELVHPKPALPQSIPFLAEDHRAWARYSHRERNEYEQRRENDEADSGTDEIEESFEEEAIIVLHDLDAYHWEAAGLAKSWTDERAPKHVGEVLRVG